MFLTQLEVTLARILAHLMVEMSSTLDQTNRGRRKTEVLLATAAYLRTTVDEEKNDSSWDEAVQLNKECSQL